MEYAAFLKNASISAQKCRLVADVIRGAPVARASDMLAFPTRKAEGIMAKLLNSAIANAENNHGANIDELRVSSVCVDQGLKFGRYRARARGRMAPYVKHHCHIRIVLSDGREDAPRARAAGAEE